MNRRQFLQGLALLTGYAAIPKPIVSNVLQHWGEEQLNAANAVLGVYDRKENLLAIGTVKFNPASDGVVTISDFYSTAIASGVADHVVISNDDGEVCRLSCGEMSPWHKPEADLTFNSTSINTSDDIWITELEIGHRDV